VSQEGEDLRRKRATVRRLVAVTAVCVAALAGASAVLGADVGANDDTGKYAPDGGESFYARMASLGLRQTVISVRWRPSDPETIQHGEHLDLAVASALRHGLRVVLAIYPYPPRELALQRPEKFAEYVQRVARRYPDVHQFVIGNEPNQPAFWRPQFSRRTGRNVSAPTFGVYLAMAYDSLKAMNGANTVIGVGLSPRGNDNRFGKTNVSSSPIRFLAALGRWYRASGRTRPLMDGFSLHPYPNQATDALDLGYPWPGIGFANLDRVKQALWDAFHGTPQPTTLEGLKLYLDEVGWQVGTSELRGYQNLENVSVTDERTQALIYAELIRRAQCDPDVAEVNVFGFYDDTNRLGFQAALHHADGTPRPSAAAVQGVIAEGAAACNAPAAPWRPETGVIGAWAPRIMGNRTGISVEARAAEGVLVEVCVYPRGPSAPEARRLAARSALTCIVVRGTPQRPARALFLRTHELTRGGTVTARYRVEANPERTAAFTASFR
jgi:hypothetical protein